MKVYLFAALAQFFALGLAHKPAEFESFGEGYQSFHGCGSYIISQVHFSRKDDDYSVFCTNAAAIATLVGCYAVKNRNTSTGTEFWRKQCETYLYPISYETITEGYQYLINNGVPLAQLETYTAGNLLTPVIIPREMALAALETYSVWLNNWNNAAYYGVGALCYWLLVCVVSGIANWSLFLFPQLRLALDNKVTRVWRKHVTLPALFHRSKAQSHTLFGYISCLVPSRFESLAIFVFFWLLFILNAANLHAVKHIIHFKLNTYAVTHWVGTRTGVVCIVLLPLLILFGGRNNFLMWVTRWKRDTFITFHRWIARFVVLLAFVHGVCFWRVFRLKGDFAAENSEAYVVWGIVALFLGIVMCFQGLLALRRKWYEAFLAIHLLLAVVFTVGMWYHVIDQGYSQEMYAVFAVWAFDRVVRLFRIIFFGIQRASLTLVSQDTIKVEIPKPARWKPTPGGHVYLHFMHLYYFWQSHPFTYIELETRVTFFCKVKSGVTKSLYEHLLTFPGRSCTMNMLVEGPYGESHPVKHHSDVIFIAGGNGIPGILSEFQYLSKAADGKQKLKLKWIIREIDSLSWMAEEFKKYLNSNAEITVYVTSPYLLENVRVIGGSSSDDASSGDEKRDVKCTASDVFELIRKEFSHVQFIEGRPDIKHLIESDIAEASHSAAFIACGAANMVDEVRYQVVHNIDKTQKRLDFYEALQIWA